MDFLFSRWRRSAFFQYFEALEPIDRATFWVVAALAFAFGVSVLALLH